MWPWAAALCGARWRSACSCGTSSHVGGFGRAGCSALASSALPFAALSVCACGSARDQFGRARAPLRERYGEWALVTGASAGIGAEFARALAARGALVVLTARREDRCASSRRSSRRPSTSPRASSRWIWRAPAGAERLADAVADLEIAVLVNNAGFGYAGRFEKLDAGAPARDGAAELRGAGGADAPAAAGDARARPRRDHHHRLRRGPPAAAVSRRLRRDQGLRSVFRRVALGGARGSGIDVLVLEPGPTETEFLQVAGETREAGEPPRGVVELALDASGTNPPWSRAGSTISVPISLASFLALSPCSSLNAWCARTRPRRCSSRRPRMACGL